MLPWLSIAPIILNFGGKFYFDSVFDLHEFLLPLTKEEDRQEYCRDSIVVLSGMMSKYQKSTKYVIPRERITLSFGHYFSMWKFRLSHLRRWV